MSTYNGEKYIREQMDSLLKQEGVDLHIEIRDDGSIDGTADIIKEYCKKYDNISFVKGKNIGCLDSFMALVYSAPDCEYYAFADQDDVWKSNKLIKGISMMESENDSNTPTLYFSNAHLVDENLDYIGEAVVKPKAIRNMSKYRPIFGCVALGCTMVFNKKFIELVRKSKCSRNCIMHDYWFLIIASFLGELVFDSNSYILYRQHENNVYGIKHPCKSLREKLSSYLKRIIDLFIKNDEDRIKFIYYFLKQYRDCISTKDYKKLSNIVHVDSSFLCRIKCAFDYQIIKKDTLKGTVFSSVRILLGKI